MLRTPKQKISALIITYNEMEYIQKCIDAVSFADEIIVVDSFSTDGTFEYLEGHPKVKAIQNTFKNFTAQKNFAIEQATNDWVLFVDADEVVGKKLQKEIIATINNPDSCEAYWFYRKFMFQNRPLHFSGWQTDKNHRLFKKSKARYTYEKLVHETLDVEGTSAILKEKLVHYCYKNYEDYKGKMVHYGRLKAKEKFSNGHKFSYFKLLIKPMWKFLYNYIVRLGFLDLKKGITICYLDATSVYVRYLELQKLELQLASLLKAEAAEKIKLGEKQLA